MFIGIEPLDLESGLVQVPHSIRMFGEMFAGYFSEADKHYHSSRLIIPLLKKSRRDHFLRVDVHV